MTFAHGSDVSFWQDDPGTPYSIDFERMAQGLDFVIIRAGQNLWSDKVFPRSWKDAKAAGIPRGSYWFYDSRVDPKRQAEKYIATLGDDLGELPLVADYEDSYGGQFGTVFHLHDFLERLKVLAPGKEIMLYTGYYYWREKTAIIPKAERGRLLYFTQYPLWLAWYGVPMEMVRAPEPFTRWDIWQYTASGDGSLYGVESREIDLNYYNGTVEEFRERFKLGGLPPVPPRDEPSTGEVVQSLKVRIQP